MIPERPRLLCLRLFKNLSLILPYYNLFLGETLINYKQV